MFTYKFLNDIISWIDFVRYLMKYIDLLIRKIAIMYPFFLDINYILGLILSIIVIHKAFYFVIGMFFTRKFKPAKNKHKYAILIAARNEECVIGNLIDSIHKQDYPSNLIDVFVVADNCQDRTAKIARDMGAICYERTDDLHKTKGFALEFLLDRIDEDYGRMSYDGYFIMDADNLLKSNYISKMNDAFDCGEKIVTSYRNTKNFDENWIASTYALHWIRSIRTNHRARSVLGLATNIQGTGFLIASEIVQDGWHYTGLTEDRALTADAVSQGYMITYQDEAEFYDEQPVSLRVALRQRLRWSKGHLQAFVESGPKLFVNIFFGDKFVKKKWNNDSKKNNILIDIKHRFAAFDTLVQLIPISFINLVRWFIVSAFVYSCVCYVNGISNLELYGGSTWLSVMLRRLFSYKINLEPGFFSMFVGFMVVLFVRILYRLGIYFSNMWLAVYLFIVESSRIKKISFLKKILFVFTWPTFDIIGRYTTYVALFKKVEWKPIPHNSSVTIDDVNGDN